MSVELRIKLISKCLKIYKRDKSLWPVNRFLMRLNLDSSLQSDVWENHLIPEIKRRYFPDLTVDSFLKESLILYRTAPGPFSALVDIWDMIDWKIPFNYAEYEEFVERFEELLEKESNPPSKEDWDDLNEWLGK